MDHPPGLLRKLDAFWRAANHLAVGQIHLFANPLLRKPLLLTPIKPRLPGLWAPRQDRPSSIPTSAA